MLPQEKSLAVALRGAQWAIEDAAHHMPTGAYSAEQCHHLADILETLAGVLRGYAGQPVVVEALSAQ